MSKYTKGPWQLSEPSVSFDVLRDFKGDGGYKGGGIDIFPPVCTMTWTERDKDEALATAHLISAAPELFEALAGILEIGKRDMSNPKYDGYFEFARSAVAKAKGIK